MVQPVLPYLTPEPSPQRYLDDLHTAPAAAPFSPVAGRSREDVELLTRAIARKAAASRRDLAQMFEFVFREETTRAPLRTMPHQRLVFQFVRHYPYCVVRMPVNFSKTYCMAADGLHGLGSNPTQRGAVISAAEAQAAKPLLAVKSYIEESQELRLVFPKLRPSLRDSEPWTQTAITVDRPFGIRDASLIAVGLDSQRLPGSRLNFINIDDVLDEDNTSTPDARKKTIKWVKSTGLSRLDTRGARCVCTNTPWHPEDLTYALEAIEWPSLSMDCWGGVFFKNADDFDSDEIRPSRDAAQEEAETGEPATECRLTAHDHPSYRAYAIPRTPDNRALAPAMEPRGSIEPEQDTSDAEELVPLWPEHRPTEALIEICRTMGGGAEFARSHENITRTDEEARVKEEWIEACKGKARAAGYSSIAGPARTVTATVSLSWQLVSRWTDGNAFTGADLAFSKKKKSDNVAIFTFAVLPDMRRLLLGIDVGKFKGKQILTKLRNHHDKFGSIVTIESNAAQRLLREWAVDDDPGFLVRSFETGKNKHNPDFGVESIFVELENTAWLIPCDARGKVDPAVQYWIDDLLAYRKGAHTGDCLMASWFAREQARMTGALKKGKDFWGSVDLGGITRR